MKKFILILIGIFILAGCTVKPSKVSDHQAKQIAEKMVYFQDKESGLCFGVVATRREWTLSQRGLGMAEVPCEKVKDLLVNP